MHKNLKKAVLLMVAVVTAIVLLAFSAGAFAESGTCGSNVKWSFDNTTKELVLEGTGSTTNYSYTKSPFKKSGVKSIVVKEGITYIGKGLFAQCESLEKVTIADSVTELAEDAFYNCDSLTDVKLGKGLTVLGRYAFQSCGGLENITLPDGLKTVLYASFHNCHKLKSIVIPGSVVTIGNNAFANCKALKKAVIGKGVKEIGNYVFSGCLSLESVTFSEGLETIGYSAFRNCSNLKSAIIPDSVVTIGNNAFANCKALEKAVIGKGVKSIDNYVFSGCSGLESVTFSEGLETIGHSAFRNCSNLKSAIIPDSVTSIAVYAFSLCSGLETVKLSNKLSSLKMNTFAGCKALREISIPDSITSVSNKVFYGCSNLEKITLGKGITVISDSFLRSCTNLKVVEFKGNITKVKYRAFYNCQSLAEVHFPGSKSDWKKIKIENGNYRLRNAEISCMYDPGHTHTYNTVKRPATLEKNGKIETTCTTCNNLIKVSYIYSPVNPVLNKSRFVYDGSVKQPKVTVSNTKGKKLAEGTDYVVQCDTNTSGVGEYEMNVVLTGDYQGEVKMSYRIIPGKVNGLSAEVNSGKITLTWNKLDEASFYRVYLYNFATGEYEYVKSAKKKLEYTFTDAVEGKNYYFRVRACIEKGDDIIYGNYAYEYVKA